MATRTVLVSHTGKLPSRTLPRDEHRFLAPGTGPRFYQTPSFTVRRIHRATCNMCEFKTEGDLESEVYDEMWEHLRTHMFSGTGSGADPRSDTRPGFMLR